MFKYIDKSQETFGNEKNILEYWYIADKMTSARTLSLIQFNYILSSTPNPHPRLAESVVPFLDALHRLDVRPVQGWEVIVPIALFSRDRPAFEDILEAWGAEVIHTSRNTNSMSVVLSNTREGTKGSRRETHKSDSIAFPSFSLHT